MRIALIGFGKMGREIGLIAPEQGETIARVFDSRNTMTPDSLTDIDVCIDFSSQDAVLENINIALAARTDIVVGTTGWYSQLPPLREKVRDSGLLYSPNFSLGMNMFQRIVAFAAALAQNAPDYDPHIYEAHHRQKADTPSGSALRLAEILLEKIERKKKIVSGAPSGRIESDALQVSSTRAGFVTGTHTVAFDSEADLIELRHVARNRRGFALGALMAARWLHGRKGVYTMDNVEL